jgi:hypothetical protein
MSIILKIYFEILACFRHLQCLSPVNNDTKHSNVYKLVSLLRYHRHLTTGISLFLPLMHKHNSVEFIINWSRFEQERNTCETSLLRQPLGLDQNGLYCGEVLILR